MTAEAGSDTDLRADTTVDAFLGGALQIEQRRQGHRSGLDAVLLAASCPVRPGQRIADLGSGVGVAGMCVLARVAGTSAMLIDREADATQMAVSNAARNQLSDRCTVIQHDILTGAGAGAGDLPAVLVDHVIANPPFYDPARSRTSPDAEKARAHSSDIAMPDMLERWMRLAAHLLGPSGSATVILHANALEAGLAAMRGGRGNRFGGITVTPIHPRPGSDAIRVLISGQRGSKAAMRIAPPVTLHALVGHAFTPHIAGILSSPAALEVAPQLPPSQPDAR